MNKAFIVKLIDSGFGWGGALNVRVAMDGEHEMRRVGTIVVPETEYYKGRALKKMLETGSADFLQREGYFDSVVFLPEDRLTRTALEVFVGNNRVAPGFDDDAFWGRVEKGLPAKLNPDLAKAVLDDVNEYREVAGAGIKYEIDGEGKVRTTQITGTIEQRP